MTRPPRLPPPALQGPAFGRRAARTVVAVVSVTGTIIATCAFVFSFGNVWRLALAWGLPAPIAPLVAPMLDISVVGLLVAVRQLTLHGVPERQLLGARLLMLACAVTTWALNIAQSVLDRRWGAAVMDSVAPALLLGWAEVAPALLRLAATDEQRPAEGTERAAGRSHRGPSTSTSPGSRRLAPPPDVPRLASITEQEASGFAEEEVSGRAA